MHLTYIVSQRCHPKEPVPSSVLHFINSNEPVNPVGITSPDIVDNLEVSFHPAANTGCARLRWNLDEMTISSKHHAAVLCQDHQTIQRVFHLN